MLKRRFLWLFFPTKNKHKIQPLKIFIPRNIHFQRCAKKKNLSGKSVLTRTVRSLLRVNSNLWTKVCHVSFTDVSHRSWETRTRSCPHLFPAGIWRSWSLGPWVQEGATRSPPGASEPPSAERPSPETGPSARCHQWATSQSTLYYFLLHLKKNT